MKLLLRSAPAAGRRLRLVAAVVPLLLLTSVGSAAALGFEFGTRPFGDLGLRNLSPSQTITSIEITLGSQAFFDTTDDPPGTASFPWQILTNNGVASVTLPNDAATDGQQMATISFTGFDPGDAITIAVDYDDFGVPDTDALDLAGTTVTVNFSSGSLMASVTEVATVIEGESFSWSASVPEPASGALLALGLAALATRRPRGR